MTVAFPLNASDIQNGPLRPADWPHLSNLWAFDGEEIYLVQRGLSDSSDFGALASRVSPFEGLSRTLFDPVPKQSWLSPKDYFVLIPS